MGSFNLIRNAAQARLLFAAVPPERLALHAGKTVAVQGRLELKEALAVPDGEGLWKSVRMHDHDGEQSMLVAGRETLAVFGIQDGRGDVIWVGDYPTDVVGAVSGVTQVHRSGSNMRETWLPAGRTVTVVGRVEIGEHGLELHRAGLAGLLLSNRPAQQVALTKVRDVIVLLIILALVVWIVYQLAR